MNSINKFCILILCIGSLVACSNKPSQPILELFHETVSLNQRKECLISEDSLGRVEGIACDDEYLVVFDTRSNQCFTLFDQNTGRQIGRFGDIGQGPSEVLFGSSGYLENRCIFAYNDQSKVVMKYNLDSLRNGVVTGAPMRLTKHKILDANISRLIPLNDSVFVVGGTYKSRYLHFVFDTNDQVLGYGVNVYNASDNSFNDITRFLSNQGYMAKKPHGNKFAYSVNFSSNLDFFEVIDNNIRLIKTLRFGNPLCESIVEDNGQLFSARPTKDAIHGFIEVCPTPNYMYALYTDGKIYEVKRQSKTVLVFDWDGNPVRKLLLDADALHISVNEKTHTLFAVVENEDGGFSIVCYVL